MVTDLDKVVLPVLQQRSFRSMIQVLCNRTPEICRGQFLDFDQFERRYKYANCFNRVLGNQLIKFGSRCSDISICYGTNLTGSAIFPLARVGNLYLTFNKVRRSGELPREAIFRKIYSLGNGNNGQLQLNLEDQENLDIDLCTSIPVSLIYGNICFTLAEHDSYASCYPASVELLIPNSMGNAVLENYNLMARFNDLLVMPSPTISHIYSETNDNQSPNELRWKPRFKRKGEGEVGDN
jgi:hypothetical protein